MSKIVNAKITYVSISMADHGALTFYLHLDGYGFSTLYGGYCIGFGFLGSDTFKAENGSGLVAMMKIMDVVGVERWEDLSNKYIRVVDDGWGKPIKKIGNIIQDKWFDIGEFFKEYKEDSKT